MDNIIGEYIKGKTFEFLPQQLEMESYARDHHIPIVSRDSLDLIVSLLKIKKPKSILEFGTAIGYSAILMAYHTDEDTQIITLERDKDRYDVAMDNISKVGFNHRIKVYNMDAMEARELFEEEEFDFVFIDAANGQYKVFFDLVYDRIASGGIIVSDNILHKGLVCAADIKDVDKRHRTIYKRMNSYLDFLKSKESDSFTSLIPIGDGIAITHKNERNKNE